MKTIPAIQILIVGLLIGAAVRGIVDERLAKKRRDTAPLADGVWMQIIGSEESLRIGQIVNRTTNLDLSNLVVSTTVTKRK